MKKLFRFTANIAIIAAVLCTPNNVKAHSMVSSGIVDLIFTKKSIDKTHINLCHTICTVDLKAEKIYIMDTEIMSSNNIIASGCLTAGAGVFYGPSGKETYYNLDMSGVIGNMRNMGYDKECYPYWIRNDGVKMFGDYVMVAAELGSRPKGTILESSLGTAIVCDTGAFAYSNPNQLDIATNW